MTDGTEDGPGLGGEAGGREPLRPEKEEGGAAGGVVVYQPDRHITMKRVTQSEWDSARLMGVRSSVMIAAASSFFTAFLAVAFEASRTDSVALWIASFVVLVAALVFVVLLVLDWQAWKRLNAMVDERGETS